METVYNILDSVSHTVTSACLSPLHLSFCLSVCLQVTDLVFHQHIEHWDHLDFIWGLDAPEVMFPSILKLLQEHH